LVCSDILGHWLPWQLYQLEAGLVLQYNWFHFDLANPGPEHSGSMSVYNSKTLSFFLGSITLTLVCLNNDAGRPKLAGYGGTISAPCSSFWTCRFSPHWWAPALSQKKIDDH
jgi:hypothetical protein